MEKAQSQYRRIIVASPTGSGKTTIAMQLMWNARQRGETSIFLAPRRELLKQTAQKLDRWAPFGYGMIQSSDDGPGNLYLPIQVASVDTLISRAVKRNRLVLPPMRNVFCDEAHLYQTKLRDQMMELFPDARIVGLTATPGRYDGRPLGSQYDHMIEAATPKQLIRDGYLVPGCYKAPSKPDFSKVKITAGEYNKKQHDAIMQPLLGDIVESWLNYSSDCRTLVFANQVGHSVWLAERFRAVGVSAEHCDGTASEKHRDAVFERFESGETQVLCNVDLASYGYDLPEISCVVLAKRAKSIVWYQQAVGRGARRSEGKRFFRVNDHGGNVYEHGYFEEDRHWSLSGSKSIGSRRKISGKRVKEALRLRCPKCATVFDGSLTCPECGYYFERTAKAFKVVDGELVDVRRSDVDESLLEKRMFHAELLGYAHQKGYKAGWAAHAYLSRHKAFPPHEWRSDTRQTPSVVTERYLKYLSIRRGKSRKKAAVS